MDEIATESVALILLLDIMAPVPATSKIIPMLSDR